VAAARQGAHPFAMVNALAYASVPVALWTGEVEAARQQVEELVAHTVGNSGTEPWRLSYAGVIRLRDGDQRERLIASYLEPRVDLFSISPFAELLASGDIQVPVPEQEPELVLWNTAELLRVDAELLLWHGAPDAVAAAEAKLLRALAIAREQQALAWELRCAVSLARLRRRAEARDLLVATYGKFTEGFATRDLMEARGLIAELSAG
jgi:hypothetical protein